MAKKKSAATFNMSEELRTILTANPELSGREAIEALQRKHPGAAINEGSAMQAFSSARKKLGIVTGRGAKKKKKTKKTTARQAAATRPGPQSPRATGQRVNIAHLEAAAKFLSEVGDSSTAAEAIRQVQKLQVHAQPSSRPRG